MENETHKVTESDIYNYYIPFLKNVDFKNKDSIHQWELGLEQALNDIDEWNTTLILEEIENNAAKRNRSRK